MPLPPSMHTVLGNPPYVQEMTVALPVVAGGPPCGGWGPPSWAALKLGLSKLVLSAQSG